MFLHFLSAQFLYLRYSNIMHQQFHHIPYLIPIYQLKNRPHVHKRAIHKNKFKIRFSLHLKSLFSQLRPLLSETNWDLSLRFPLRLDYDFQNSTERPVLNSFQPCKPIFPKAFLKFCNESTKIGHKFTKQSWSKLHEIKNDINESGSSKPL